MTRPDIERLLALAEAATTPPWKSNTADKTGDDWLIGSLGNSNEDGQDYIVTTDRVRASELDGDAKDDAAFIAESRTALPELCAYALALEARVAALEEGLRWFLDDQRFHVSVGGNPKVVEEMISRAHALLTKHTEKTND